MPRSIVLHGHFYQPPREDPWFEEIARQPSAAPYHDWNARIEHECYRAIVAARVLDDEGRIARVVNALAYTSFDAGPTLLAWLERESPATYAAVLEADRASAVRLGGHGNAIAQAYHHAILPLASRRDKVTEVRWGIADFRRRFGREPEGMWLPETAVDDETLDVLAAEGIRFTILAPHQVTGAPARGMPGRYHTANGRDIALFVYDGATSHGIAFGGLLNDASAWAARLARGASAAGAPELISVATDGETYGHHHRFGEMALAAVIDALEPRAEVRLENYASFLARHPATAPVTLAGTTAWSCSHGVERWRGDCGCGSSGTAPSQAWRAPFREAVQALADDAHAAFEREAAAFFPDPWTARDAYADEPDAAAETPPVRARELLELERNALRLFTSCAWFFDDIDRLEPLQVLRYAARTIELAGPAGAAMEAGFLERLAGAVGNDPRSGSARDIYLRDAKPLASPYAAIAAAHALADALGVPDAPVQTRACTVQRRGTHTVVRELLTGREHAFHAEVLPGETESSARRARHAVVEVRPVGAPAGDARRLTPADRPERTRAALERAIRCRTVSTDFDAASRARLAAGDPLGEVVPGALLHAVSALATSRAAPAVRRVLDVLDLAEELDVGIPYDVQTAFARVRDELAGGALLLGPVASRLGFATRARPAAVPAAVG